MTFVPPEHVSFETSPCNNGCTVTRIRQGGNEVLSIHWANRRGSLGATPLHVLQALRMRIETEQKGDLASPANAKALALVMEAEAILSGRQAEFDGIPIIGN